MAKILLVDDDPLVSDMLVQLLTDHGHQVETAVNGHDAFETLSANRPDLLITDIIMPGENGLGLIRNVREKYPTLTIIAMSGGGRGGSEDYLECAKAYGANHTFSKPLHIKSFLDTLPS